MPELVQQLVTDVRIEGAFDVSDAQALRWLDRRHKMMCARSRCIRRKVAVATTVAGQSFYPLSGVIELFSLEVGGVPYGRARRGDAHGYASGSLAWEGPGGLVLADASSAGVGGLTLIPTQGAGLAIEAFAAMMPDALTLSGTVAVDDDMAEHLVAGAMATGLMRPGEARPDLAGPLEQQFAAACEELRRRVARRFRGGGPSQIRVVGINA